MRVPGFGPCDAGVTTEQIAGAERVLGVRFPSQYSELLRTHAGSYGEAEFSVAGAPSASSIGHWLSLSPWETESLWATLSFWREHQLPHSLVPIASDGGGNLVCLDYRESGEPSVAMWFHELMGEAGLTVVAQSFTQFMENLREPAA